MFMASCVCGLLACPKHAIFSNIAFEFYLENLHMLRKVPGGKDAKVQLQYCGQSRTRELLASNSVALTACTNDTRTTSLMPFKLLPIWLHNILLPNHS